MELTSEQAIATVYLCQKLTTTLCSIELLRFDETRLIIYIVAINQRGEDIEATINQKGEIGFL
ncbi:MAG: hypothetical protein RI580_06275 [Halothece sp. Uz-M2-17]|nr:hypothetical protein [Halothece sp. Uz-M2-17]